MLLLLLMLPWIAKCTCIFKNKFARVRETILSLFALTSNINISQQSRALHNIQRGCSAEEWVLLLLGYFNLFASSWHSTHRHLYLQCNYASKRLRGALLSPREEAAEEDQTFKRDSVGWLLQMLSVQIAKELHFQTWLNNSPFSWLHRQTERFAPPQFTPTLGAPFPDFFSSFIPPIVLHCGWLFNYLFIWVSYFVSVNVPESPPNIVCVVVVGFTWSGRGGEERRGGIVVTRLGKLLYFRQLTISAKWFSSHHRAIEHIEVGRAGGLFDAEVSLSLQVILAASESRNPLLLIKTIAAAAASSSARQCDYFQWHFWLHHGSVFRDRAGSATISTRTTSGS